MRLGSRSVLAQYNLRAIVCQSHNKKKMRFDDRRRRVVNQIKIESSMRPHEARKC